MTTSEKVAYLKGLAEGMGIQEDGGQGKLFHVIIDILEDLSLDLADTKDALVDLTDGVDQCKIDLEWSMPAEETRYKCWPTGHGAMLDNGKAGKDGNGSLVFTGLAFHGVPSGHEFNSFVLGLYNAAGPGQPLGDDLIERAKSIASPLNIMILVSLTCTMCPETVLASQRLASLNPAVRAEAYDVSHFPELKDQYGAMSVPCIVINRGSEQTVEFGKKSIPQMLELVGA